MVRILMVAAFVLLLLSAMFLGYVLFVAQPPSSGPAHIDPLRSLEQPLWPAPEFRLLRSDGETVSDSQLEDKIWLAAFIFTRCPGPCPLITQRMREIQEALVDQPDFRLVSFSVDPSYDRPEVLAEYARQWKADTSRWWFLTEDDPGEILALAGEFKIAAERAEDSGEGPPNIIHGTNILLIDQEGWVRALFSSEDPEVTSQVVEAVNKLGGDG